MYMNGVAVLPLRTFRRAGALAMATAVLSLGLTGAASAEPAPVPASAGPCALPVLSRLCPPKTVVLDGNRLLLNKIALLVGDRTTKTALGNLVKQADVAVKAGPWTVVDKERVPPSGDKHDYLSLAPYWWPSRPKTPENPLGCPYVQRDGVLNPETTAVPDKAEGSRHSARSTSSRWPGTTPARPTTPGARRSTCAPGSTTRPRR
jgi:hypothetical protein